MRKIFVFVVATALFVNGPAITLSPVQHTIQNDPGGLIMQYVSKYVTWNSRGDRARIQGSCMSACTLVLGALDGHSVCATRHAQFGFHSAVLDNGQFAPAGTAFMWSFYGPKIRAALERHGWAGPTYHPDLLVINAQELVRPCE